MRVTGLASLTDFARQLKQRDPLRPRVFVGLVR
jgi:hypothetical protein